MKNKQLFKSRQEWDEFKKKFSYDPSIRRHHQIVLEEGTKPPKSYPALGCFTEQIYMTEANCLMVVFVYPSDFK